MDQALTFIKVTDESLVQAVVLLAQEIWTEHYVPIVGKAQVEYMLKEFQSEAAITRQIKTEGYLYYLIKCDRSVVGYIGMVPEAGAALSLSKFYLRAEERGKGYGKQALHFVENMSRSLHLGKIRLTVNKHNTASISAYLAMGFQNAGPIIQDIGAGFFMDDYIMEKTLYA